MDNKFKEATDFAIAFVRRHKTSIAVVGTAVVTTVLCQRLGQAGATQFIDFIAEKGLLDEYNARFDDTL